MGTPSKFFATFSLRELVNSGEPGPSTSGQWGIPGSIGGPIGRGVAFGGSIGGSSGVAGGYRSSGEAHCSKSESLSLPVILSGPDRFDEQEFIKSLKERLEQLISDRAGLITQSGDIPGSFHSSEFYVEYHQADVQGRIVLSGRLSDNNYRVSAQIEERSEAGGFDIHESSQGGLSPADAYRMMRPEGDYNVVALDRDHPVSGHDGLLQLGQELIKGSIDRLKRGMPRDALKDLKYAEVWTLAKLPSHLQRLLAENSELENTFEVPAEYQGYETVFFLNDIALTMFSEAGIALEVMKTISASEMPTSAHRSLRGPYLPKS